MDKIVLQIIINYFSQPFIHCVIPIVLCNSEKITSLVLIQSTKPPPSPQQIEHIRASRNDGRNIDCIDKDWPQALKSFSISISQLLGTI